MALNKINKFFKLIIINQPDPLITFNKAVLNFKVNKMTNLNKVMLKIRKKLIFSKVSIKSTIIINN